IVAAKRVGSHHSGEIVAQGRRIRGAHAAVGREGVESADGWLRHRSYHGIRKGWIRREAIAIETRSCHPNVIGEEDNSQRAHGFAPHGAGSESSEHTLQQYRSAQNEEQDTIREQLERPSETIEKQDKGEDDP